MKVFIFGVDALDYDLVEKWNMKGLKQKEYKKLQIPKEIETLSTPTLWATIITGELPNEHGVNYGWMVDEYKYPLVLKLRKIVHKTKIENIILKTITTHKFFRKIVTEIVKKNRIKQEFKLKCPTIFDDVNSIEIGVPTYSKTEENTYKIHKNMIGFLQEKLDENKWEKIIRNKFEDVKRTLFENLNKDWELFMVYFGVIDYIGHTFFDNETKIKSYYKEIEELVIKIKKQLKDDIVFFIVSDHGMKIGLHTRYAFYSSNIELEIGNPKLTDFYNIVKSKVTSNA